MKTEIFEAANAAYLTIREVNTDGSNAYPSVAIQRGEADHFISGFDSFAQVEAFAEAHGLRVVETEIKDGGSFAGRCYPRYKAFNSGEYVAAAGENYYTEYSDGDEYEAENLETLKEILQDCESFDEIQAFVQKFTELRDEIHGNWENGDISIVRDFQVYETFARAGQMSFHHDSTRYEIGVLVPFEKEDQND